MNIDWFKNHYEEIYFPFINEILYNENFIPIRLNADELLKFNEEDFCLKIDYAIAKSNIWPVEIHDPVTNNLIDDAGEYVFLNYLDLQCSRSHLILEDFFEHRDTQNRSTPNRYDTFNEENLVKWQLVRIKLKRISYQKELSLLKNSIQDLRKPPKSSEKNTLKGKKLNLLERFEIAKQILNIETQIRKLDISEAEKCKLLSIILDCNTTNARHILNGKYPGKIRYDLISEYISEIMK
ncbi:MAG: hypothetical protein ABGW97_07240 [Christiangramia sp.]|uniref:hypothetical protein n=1 Tax=Christiangramia sp. TaxID=1931228 RepID=UPI003242ADCB